MSVFISVVSHGHADLIIKLGCLAQLAEKFHVVVKINREERGLPEYLEEHGIHYINSDYGLGFGHNNNIVYRYCQDPLGMKDDDIFCVFNPDVVSTPVIFRRLVEQMESDGCQLAGVNLYKDQKFTVPDNSIRHFPSLLQFVKSFLGLGNNTQIDKSKVLTPTSVDWAAGSFLAFKSSLYQQLRGFDQGYFMYCEDIDICFRSKKMGVPLTFYPDIKMLHLAKHANRKILSKHFYWHVSSVFRFLLSKVGFVRFRTIL